MASIRPVLSLPILQEIILKSFFSIGMSISLRSNRISISRSWCLLLALGQQQLTPLISPEWNLAIRSWYRVWVPLEYSLSPLQSPLELLKSLSLEGQTID